MLSPSRGLALFCAALSALAESRIARARLFLYFLLITGTAHYVLLTCTNTTRIESCHNDFSFVLHHWHLTPFTERLTMQRGFHGLLYPRPASSSSSFSCPPPRQQQRLRLLVTSVPLPSFSITRCTFLPFNKISSTAASLFFLCKDSPARALQVPLLKQVHSHISAQNFNTLSAFSSSRQVVAKENVVFQNFA